MKYIYIVAEGSTEVRFIKEVLAPWFAAKNIFLYPYRVITSKDRKAGKTYRGGMTGYAKAKKDIVACMKTHQGNDVFYTTMFDLYRLPDDFPGMPVSGAIRDPYSRISALEKAFQDDIDHVHFIPYIQLHEFESLLFSHLQGLAESYPERGKNIQPLYQALEEYRNPELINEGSETAPSKRILKCIPEYDKNTMGVLIT